MASSNIPPEETPAGVTNKEFSDWAGVEPQTLPPGHFRRRLTPKMLDGIRDDMEAIDWKGVDLPPLKIPRSIHALGTLLPIAAGAFLLFVGAFALVSFFLGE